MDLQSSLRLTHDATKTLVCIYALHPENRTANSQKRQCLENDRVDKTAKTVVTVDEFLGVEVIEGKGIAIQFLGSDCREHLIQVPIDEAHTLADLLAIALSRASKP